MIKRFRDAVRTSYWFIPILMICAAIGLSILTVWIDRTLVQGRLQEINWLYSHSPEGARALLQAVGGSMITIAGVVFSIMIVVLALAANQFGSRLLRNYMRDRGNQFTLGTFVATFVFCLMVMRTVQGNVDGRAFVPFLSVSVAVVLAIASVIVLIYFIHHTTQSIQSENILAALTVEFRNELEQLLPEADQENAYANPAATLPHDFASRCRTVEAPSSGYIKMVETRSLTQLAADHDLFIECLPKPGDFVLKGSPIARYTSPIDEEDRIKSTIRRAFSIGRYRTYLQDVDFAIQQILLIMVRATSPAIHDPFTAIACLDRLGESLSLLAAKRLPPSKHFDKNGRLRLVLPEASAMSLLDYSLTVARQAARGSVLVSRHFMRTVAAIGQGVRAEDLHGLLRRQAMQAMEDNEQIIQVRSDLRELRHELQRTLTCTGNLAA